MSNSIDSNNILALLDNFTFTDADDVAMDLARDFRNRRIEKGITRKMIADKSGVAVANVARFEQKGLISLKNLIQLAMALNYVHEIKSVFTTPKYATMEELAQIRRNQGKKKASKPTNETY